MSDMIPIELITEKIYIIRGQKVMLDRDLAELYGVKTSVLKRQVNRNIERFPTDFMFELTKEEFLNWRRQFVTSNSDKMGLRYKPYAFTEQGVSMLSSVLNSKRAIDVNIQIMRTFAKMREMMFSYKELKEKIEKMESKYDKQFRIVFDALRRLLEPPEKETKKIGF